MSAPSTTTPEPAPTPVAIGLGSTETAARLDQAVDALRRGGLTHIQVGKLCRTAPVDCVPGTPDFFNSALTGLWTGSAESLLALCQQIERQLGRPTQHSSHEARSIDLDILLFGHLELRTPQLTLPHPRLCQRRFALQPLASIAPDWFIPGTIPPATVAQALARLPPA